MKVFTYNAIVGRLIRFALHRQTAIDGYPHAWASLVVTSMFVAYVMALNLLFVRIGIIQSPESGSVYWPVAKPVSVVLFLLAYVGHLIFYGFNNRWKAILKELDQLTLKQIRILDRITFAFVAVGLSWLFLEIALALAA